MKNTTFYHPPLLARNRPVWLIVLLLVSACATNPAVIKHPKATGEPFHTDIYLIGEIKTSNMPPKVMLPAPPVAVDRGEFTDERDGQVYKWVKVGKQVWMTQNLNYRTAAHSRAYNDDEANGKTYGRLYSFDALLEACPKGWHVPTDTEWMLLERDMGIRGDTGEVGSRGDIATRFLPGYAVGFDVLYCGLYNKDGFKDMSKAAYFWSSTGYGATPIADREFKKGKSGIYRNTVERDIGLSLRCVKNYWEN